MEVVVGRVVERGLEMEGGSERELSDGGVKRGGLELEGGGDDGGKAGVLLPHPQATS